MPLWNNRLSVRETERLRLEPIRPSHLEDYLRVFNDDAIAEYYVGRPTREEAQRDIALIASAWDVVGVHKWLAYERSSGEVVGRGGLSRVCVDSDLGRAIRKFLPRAPWVREAVESDRGLGLAQRWLEIGWALRGDFWGRGYASEIGRAGLDFALAELDAKAVVSFTERHNERSRAVMARIGMRHAGEFLWEGLVEGRDGVHANAPFSLYVVTHTS